MRLEFKVERPAYMRDADWAKFVARGYGDFKFNILVGDTVVPLAVPAGQSADKYFSSRISATNPNALYLSVNLAITDAPYTGVQTSPRGFQDGPLHGQSDVPGLEPRSVPRARGQAAAGLLRVR